MNTFPIVGDVLVVTKELYTGEDDFTVNNPQMPGTICTVLTSNEHAFRAFDEQTIILTLLFPGGVIEWHTTWALWYFYLKISE